MTSVYEYLNYREYLKDALTYLKKHEEGFTMKLMQYELQARSTGFISNVIAGRKNLTHAQVQKVSEVFKHPKTEAQYFEALYYFTRAKKSDEKERFFQTMLSLKKTKFKEIDPQSMSLFSHWYNVFVREALGMFIFDGDFKALGQLLIPAITESEARKSVQTLQALGFIEWKGKDGYVLSDPIITTGDEVKSMFLMGYHKAMLKNAIDALDVAPASERDMSIVSLSLSKKSYAAVKNEIQAIRKKIMKLAENEKVPEKIYTLNMQLFPVTKNITRRRKK